MHHVAQLLIFIGCLRHGGYLNMALRFFNSSVAGSLFVNSFINNRSYFPYVNFLLTTQLATPQIRVEKAIYKKNKHNDGVMQ